MHTFIRAFAAECGRTGDAGFTFDTFGVKSYNSFKSKRFLVTIRMRGDIMADRVTIQDIADALGISRNTVSKAINNTGVLAEATREKILLKAVEMGYKQFSYINLENSGSSLSLNIRPDSSREEGGIIALLTTTLLDSSHFSSTMLDKIHRELSQAEYSLTMYRITPDELAAKRLPAAFSPEKISGILCIEVFDLEYSLFLTSLNIPILFIDAPVPRPGIKLAADVLLMDNKTEVYSFVEEMKKRGKKTFGYVGKASHCRSFMERYLALKEALQFSGLPFNKEYSIPELAPGMKMIGGRDYQDYLLEKLKQMPELPDVFFCANDFVAYDLLQVCKARGIRVPEDFCLCGFDDSPESRVMTPTLTTIHIHSQVMGYSAVQLILTRIRQPGINYRTVYTETSLIYRESTGD